MPSVNILRSGVYPASSPRSYVNTPFVSVGQDAGSTAMRSTSLCFPVSLSPANGNEMPAKLVLHLYTRSLHQGSRLPLPAARGFLVLSPSGAGRHGLILSPGHSLYCYGMPRLRQLRKWLFQTSRVSGSFSSIARPEFVLVLGLGNAFCSPDLHHGFSVGFLCVA